MTNEEAIEVLKDMLDYQWGFADDEKPKSIEALKLAIESLKNSIDYRDLDDTIMRLNEQGWEITRYEYKRIDGVLFEMKENKQ